MAGYRLAKCGHLAPYVSGPQRRVCEACARRTVRVCRRCSADITGKRSDAIYCSERCSDIVRGMRRAVPVAPRVCALEECAVRFVPARDNVRCCSAAHGKLLYSRERRARREAVIA